MSKIKKIYTDKRKRDLLNKKLPFVVQLLEFGVPFKYINEEFKLHISSLSELHSLLDIHSILGFTDQDTFLLHFKINDFKKKLKLLLVRKTSYALLLITLAYFLSIFFLFFFVPKIQAVILTQKNLENEAIYLLVKTTFVLSSVIFMFVLILSIMIKKDDLKVTGFLILERYKIMNGTRLYISHLFALTWLMALKHVSNTQKVLQIMRFFKNEIWISWLAYHLDERIEKGMSLSSAVDMPYFSSIFIAYIKQGLLTETIQHALENYLALSLVLLKQKIHHIAKILTVYAFGYLLLIIVAYYTYLFLPIKMMEGML